MTQEEKAKAYDEAIKKLRSLHDDYNTVSTLIDIKEELENIFPELKESEDERIRKSLAAYFAKFKQSDMWDDGFSCSDILAWFEKQGKQKPVMNIDIPFGAKDSELIEESYYIPEGFHAEIEGNTVVIKKGEQNPADKVKPKFKVGDWVVFNNKHQSIYQIEKIEDGYYILRHMHGGTFRICILHDESLRFWTIQDAKDGDVLCSGQLIVLFKKWEDDNAYTFVIAHAGIGISGKLHITKGHWLISNDSKPATKEQRDLLFVKMKEAGYEWDEEKKELKKIEQNPAWSKADETGLSDALWAIKQAMTIAKDENDMGNLWYAERFLKRLKDRYTWKPSKEQLRELRCVISGCSYDIEPLVQLEEQLKKLREE